MEFLYSWLKRLFHFQNPPQGPLNLEPRLRTNIYVGEVLEFKKHPNADRLSVVKVKMGDKIIEPVVCGAQNLAIGQKVPLALPGAEIRDYRNGGKIETLQKMKIRGIESQGMICSIYELGLGTLSEKPEIMVLKNDIEPGVPFNPQMIKK